MRGVSANVMCGQEGYFGTGSFQVVLNIEEMTKLNEKVMEETSEQEKIEQMFGAIDNPDDPCSTTNLSIQITLQTLQKKILVILMTTMMLDSITIYYYYHYSYYYPYYYLYYYLY